MEKVIYFLVIFSTLHTLVQATADVSVTNNRKDCPRNWTKFERTKSCYIVQDQRLKWADAEKQCQKFGAHLTSVVDEYENIFIYDFAKKYNLSVPTVWMGKINRMNKIGAYEWHDSQLGRYGAGFRGEPYSGTNICLTMWLDYERPEGSWNEWDCNYSPGYSFICKKSFRRNPQQQVTAPPSHTEGQINLQQTEQSTNKPPQHASKRCCVNCQEKCGNNERCIPDDLNCLINQCNGTAPGWCLPVPT